MNAFKFLREFVAHPVDIGAVSPTSRKVAEAITAAGGVSRAGVVVEWGAGTGAITTSIVHALQPGSQFIACEINPEFCKTLRRRFPDIQVVEDSATNTHRYLAELGVERCDALISGLPFAGFDDDLQNALLDEVDRILAPNGTFVTFGYVQARLLPGGRKIKDKLNRRFQHVGTTRTIWKNLPPAFAYVARNYAA